MVKKFFNTMWKSGSVKTLVLILILGSVVLGFRNVKEESAWTEFYCKIKVSNTIFADSVYWYADTLKNERWVSARKLEGDTCILVSFDQFRDLAKISPAHPKYQIEDFWWYGLAMDFFPSNSGDRWEVFFEQQDDVNYLVCKRLLITQTYVGMIFSTAFCLAFLVFMFWNKLPSGNKKE